MIQQEQSEIYRNFAGFSQLGPGEMYADPTGYPGGSPQFAFSRKTSYTAPPKISARSSTRPPARPLSSDLFRCFAPLVQLLGAGLALRERGLLVEEGLQRVDCVLGSVVGGAHGLQGVRDFLYLGCK